MHQSNLCRFSVSNPVITATYPLKYKRAAFPIDSSTHHYNQLTMSDSYRKDIHEKIESKLKPDSQKNSGELVKDKVTDNLDNAIGDSTRKGDKGFVQQAADKVFGHN